MSIRAEQEYLKAILDRYRYSSKKEKQSILDEFCQVCGYNRKYAIRLLQLKMASPTKNKRRTHLPAGRPKQYNDPELLAFLTRLWQATNGACSKRLHAIIPLWLRS